MQRNLMPLPCPADASAVGLIPSSSRVTELLAPVRTIPRYHNGEFDGLTEIWECRTVSVGDLPDLRRQLSLVEAALRPGDPGAVLARVHGLLAHYRGAELPESVERSIAADWLDDLSEFPLSVVEQACRQWRRGTKMRFRPLPGEIREACLEIVGEAMTMRDRLRKLVASVPTAATPESTRDRAADVRNRVVALATARRMP